MIDVTIEDGYDFDSDEVNHAFEALIDAYKEGESTRLLKLARKMAEAMIDRCDDEELTDREIFAAKCDYEYERAKDRILEGHHVG
jgi:hypothetical protein